MGKAENIISQVLERMLPVGSIVEWSPVDGGKADLSSADKVAAYYGFGAWEAYGSGQMLLGVSSTHAVGSTGGEEEHKLTVNEMPLHSHGIYLPGSNAGTSIEYFSNSVYHYVENGASVSSAGNMIRPAGGGQPHNNLPPYITIYRWRRIA